MRIIVKEDFGEVVYQTNHLDTGGEHGVMFRDDEKGICLICLDEDTIITFDRKVREEIV